LPNKSQQSTTAQVTTTYQELKVLSLACWSIGFTTGGVDSVAFPPGALVVGLVGAFGAGLEEEAAAAAAGTLVLGCCLSVAVSEARDSFVSGGVGSFVDKLLFTSTLACVGSLTVLGSCIFYDK